MQHNEPSYDIHEKIAQLETELLQHELLIRRQKHVISSLKTMITSPQRAWNNSDETVVQTAPRNIASSSAAPSVRSNKASSKGAPVPVQAQVPTSAQASTSSAGAQRKNGTATSAIVFQYCASIPKFGAAVAPKRKRSTVNVVEESEGQASKRSRVSNAPAETSNSSSSGTSSSGQRRVSHSSGAALSAEEEEAEDLADEEAFLATAGAKLSYLNAMRAQNRSAQNNTSTSSSTHSNINNSLSQQRVSPRPVMVPVQLRPSASVPQSQPAAVRNTVANSSSKSEQKNGNNSSTNNITSSSSDSKARLTGMESSNSVPRPTTTAVASVSNINKSMGKPVTIATPTSSKQSTNTATATATKTNATTLSGLTTPTLHNKASFPASVSLSSPITSPRNLLTGSTHKNKAIYEYCQQVRSLEEKLEVAKDMHSNILSNPRRLQQFLDSTGGRDLFLSWLTEGMEQIEAGDLRADEELAQTKLMEYTVLLINQAYWNAKSVSELKFDKTLKALYRLFEDRRGPHHITVSNIVKGIWPSYRIMRKQHEASSKGSNKNNNVFVVD
eukprot:gene9684-11384_t